MILHLFVLLTFAWSIDCQTQLTSNVTVSSSVSRGTYAYFYVNVPASNSYDVNVKVEQTGGTVVTTVYYLLNQLPTTINYDGSFSGAANPKLFPITSCNADAGNWYIGVYGSTSFTYTSVNFDITVTLQAHPCYTPLVNKSSDAWNVWYTKWTYYSFVIPSDYNFEPTITFNQLSGTTATRVYLKSGQIPSTTDYDFSYSGSDNPKVWHLNACYMSAGTWYIGVYGDTTASYSFLPYSLNFTLESRSCVTSLANNSLETWRVHRAEFVYYSFEVPTSGSYYLDININQLSGVTDIDVYLRLGQTPSTTAYNYANSAASNLKWMPVSACDLTAGTWYIGVRGDTTYTYFNLPFTIIYTLTPHLCVTPMTNGQSDTWKMYYLNWAYYSFDIPSSNSYALSVTVQQLSGLTDHNVYIRYGQPPTTTAYTYGITGGANPKQEHITPCSISAGTWYIGVYGDNTYSYQTNPFTITLNIPAHPCTTSFSLNQYELWSSYYTQFLYYSIAIQSQNSRVFFKVDQTSVGIDTSLYTRYGALPTTSTYDLSSTSTAVDPKTITYYACSLNVGGVYYAGVYGVGAYYQVGFNFSISGDNHACITPISNMESDTYSIFQTEKLYYQIQMSQSTALDFRSILAVSSGSIDMYAKVGSLPTTTSYDYVSLNIVNRANITIPSTAFITGSTIYVALIGDVNSAYTITVYTGWSCPNNCSSRGACHLRQCYCEPGYSGADCSISGCPSNCNGRGTCSNGLCFCYPGYEGNACQSQTCPNNCFGNGDCSGNTCLCYPGWTGVDCSQRICNGTNDCSGNGFCSPLGVCECPPQFGGRDCSLGNCSPLTTGNPIVTTGSNAPVTTGTIPAPATTGSTPTPVESSSFQLFPMMIGLLVIVLV